MPVSCGRHGVETAAEGKRPLMARVLLVPGVKYDDLSKCPFGCGACDCASRNRNERRDEYRCERWRPDDRRS